MANLLRTEQVPGQDREIRYYDDGTSSAVTMPQGYYTGSQNGALPSPTASENRISSETPSDAYKGLVGTTGSNEYQSAYKDWLASQKATGNSSIDEAAIRQNTLNQFQSEIDALNRVYAEKRKEALTDINASQGSASAIQARRGLLGSDFGASQTATVQKAGQSVLDSIEAERASKESGILSEARGASTAEIEKKTAEKKEALNSYLEALKGEGTETATNKAETIRRILANKVNVSDDLLKSLAEQLGVTFEELKADYNIAKSSEASSAAAAQAEAQKEAINLGKTQAETAKIISDTERSGEQAKTKQEVDMLTKGYSYVATPAERDALKKQGYSTTTVGGRTYAKPPITKTIQVGKTEYLVTYDEQGNIINRKAIGTGGGSNTPKSPNTEKTAIAEMTGAMSEVSGSDGYISPDNYTTLRNQWVQAGMNPTKFDTTFKGYRNPNNSNYIVNKQ